MRNQLARGSSIVMYTIMKIIFRAQHHRENKEIKRQRAAISINSESA